MVKLNSIKKNADVLFASNIWMPKVLHFYELKFGIWHQIGYVQNHERHCIIKYDWIICMQKSLPTTIYVWSHCVRGFIPMDGRIYIKIIYIMCIKIIPTAWAVHGCTACLNIALCGFSRKQRRSHSVPYLEHFYFKFVFLACTSCHRIAMYIRYLGL